jgi:hypothetical protein
MLHPVVWQETERQLEDSCLSFAAAGEYTEIIRNADTSRVALLATSLVLLGQSLNSYPGWQFVTDLLNCGNLKLEAAALTWAKVHKCEIRQLSHCRHLGGLPSSLVRFYYGRRTSVIDCSFDHPKWDSR